MSNQILDAPEYSFEEIRNNLLKGGLREVYEKEGAIIVKETDEVRVKIIQEGNGYQVQPMWAPIGNGAQALFSIAFIFILRFFRIPYFFLIGIILGFMAAHIYYLPKCNKLKERVEKLISGGPAT